MPDETPTPLREMINASRRLEAAFVEAGPYENDGEINRLADARDGIDRESSTRCVTPTTPHGPTCSMSPWTCSPTNLVRDTALSPALRQALRAARELKETNR